MTHKKSHPDPVKAIGDEASDESMPAFDSATTLDDESLEAFAQIATERDQYKDQLLRALVDLQNYRRRTEQQMEEFRRYATEDMVRRILPILDNFERAIQARSAGASAESTLEGLVAIEKQLRQVLETARVAKIDALGKPFDPEFHEAVLTHVSEEHDEGTILEELEPGYKMSERVIRPAKVKVSRRG